jgi:hypothetical protein
MNTLWVTVVLALPLGVKAPDPADVKPGWLGFGLFLALAVATVLLWLSMRKQLKKVDFVEEPDPDPEPQPGKQPLARSPLDSRADSPADHRTDPPQDAPERPRA